MVTTNLPEVEVMVICVLNACSTHPGFQCTHGKSLADPAAPWTFTRIPTRLTLDYIFTPGGVVGKSNVPGKANCKVIHPELEKDGPNDLIDDAVPKIPYSFFGSWDQLSDHYPVFMEFEPPTVPGGNAANKRAFLNVIQEWP